MNLNNAELLPGIVRSNEDPERLGRIKLVLAGHFTDNMELDNIPWAYPMSHSGHNSFDLPEEQAKVWVLVNKSNYAEYWYFPYFEMQQNTEKVALDYDNTHVIFGKDVMDGSAQIHYKDAEGLTLHLAESIQNFAPNGNITIYNPGLVGVGIADSLVKVGYRDKEFDQTILGSQLVSMLTKMGATFKDLAEASMRSPYTCELVPLFRNLSQIIEDCSDKLLTTYARVN